MNKNIYLQQCLNDLSLKRAKAQSIALKNYNIAHQNQDFVQKEKEEKSLIIVLGKAKAYGKSTLEIEKELTKIRYEKEQILNQIGLSLANLEPEYECKICKDVGYVNGGMCQCLKALLNKTLIVKSGAGKENLSDFSEFNPDLAKDEQHKTQLKKLKKKFQEISENYPSIPYRYIVLSGKTGVGKTFISECLAKELINKGNMVSFISAFGMNNLFLSYHTSFDDQKQSYLSALIDPDVLVIDDLGTEPMLKNVTKEYLFLILSERSIQHKLTVVTTNLDPNNILERYSERIFSRLFNKRESFLTQITGNDLRLTSK